MDGHLSRALPTPPEAVWSDRGRTPDRTQASSARAGSEQSVLVLCEPHHASAPGRDRNAAAEGYLGRTYPKDRIVPQVTEHGLQSRPASARPTDVKSAADRPTPDRRSRFPTGRCPLPPARRAVVRRCRPRRPLRSRLVPRSAPPLYWRSQKFRPGGKKRLRAGGRRMIAGRRAGQRIGNDLAQGVSG